MSNKTITMPLEEYERLLAMQPEIVHIKNWEGTLPLSRKPKETGRSTLALFVAL